MTELDELVKIRKLLEYLVRNTMRKTDGAKFEESNVAEISK